MVPADWDIGQDDEVVGRALAFTGKVVSARFVETLSRCGGSLPAWQVLLTLTSTGPISQRELAERIHLDGATVTYHLDRFESAGLVSRRRDPDDRRVWRAELTPAGTDAFESMKQGALAFETALRAGLDDDELNHFFKILGRLNANATAFDPAMTSGGSNGRKAANPGDAPGPGAPSDDDPALAATAPPPERSA